MTDAVCINNVNFSYGSNKILRNFCAHVKYSQIYSLLGPSGGGKTTLLKLILGRLKVQQGQISVLGMPPGEANSNISFMPQEIGLCYNFSINQTLRYFKLIYQISNEDFYTRRKTLTKLVNLPNGDRLVSQLSGGTQRRLSIAVSLINNPGLVILDEPTVGIDAVLRNEIWHYLVDKCRQGMTIIIVTHYIEEAANSNRVGLLRNGHLLAEDDPKRLLALYQEPNLEAVFLKLCCFEDKSITSGKRYTNQPANYNQQNGNGNGYFDSATYPAKPPGHKDPNNNEMFVVTSADTGGNDRNDSISSSSTSSFGTRLWAVKFWILVSLVYRNLAKFFYSYFSIIIILLPATQALIYCLAVSKDTVHLKAAVFNQELEPGYGNEFIRQLKQVRDYAIQPTMHSSWESALKAVHNRSALGAIWIPNNYTESFDIRIEDAFNADNATVDNSTIRLYMDNSMYVQSLEFVHTLLESFTDFSKTVFKEKDMQAIEFPVELEMTELSKDFRFRDYYMPGYFLLFMYIAQITVASLTLTQERKDGLFERSLVAGVSHELIFISHIVTSCIISIVQIVLLDLTAFGMFTNPNNGSYWLHFVFFLLQSLNAMSLGFVISSLIDHEVACLILVWFITIPQILSSGVFWPLESIQKPYMYIFYLWPLSIPVSTIRHIVLQGWDLSNVHVQYGFLSSGIPMIFFFYAALLIFKHK